MSKHTAVNWTVFNADYIEMIYNQLRQQLWFETEFPVTKDKNKWSTLTSAQKETYIRVLGGLTLLDTKQGGEGMPLISMHMKDSQRKAIFNFNAAMEDIHAKSYSHIFMTLCTKEEIDSVFEWVEENPFLQRKAEIIVDGYYTKLMKPAASPREVYMALVASVFLESFLFYSGFYYPLFLAGHGLLTSSGEIINLILRDEAIHGLVSGLVAQEIRNEMTDEEKESVDEEAIRLLELLYENELAYTADVYANLGQEMVEDVGRFLRYNANRALMNLGYDEYFDSEEEEVNAVVINGLSTKTKQHDFFSLKGNGYIRTMNTVPMEDEDFIFDDLPLYA